MPKSGHEEEQAEQKAPEGAASGTGTGLGGGLMQLHLAVRLLGHPGHVLDVDQELLLHPLQRGRGLGSRALVGIRDDCKGARHIQLLSWATPTMDRENHSLGTSRRALQHGI